MGVGSGVVISSYSKILESAGLQADILAVDINTKALEISKRMFEHNGITNISLVESNLFSAIGDLFDVIVFNPPYVVTADEELNEA